MSEETIKEFQLQIKDKDKWIRQLLKENALLKSHVCERNDACYYSQWLESIETIRELESCPFCGTTEMLCGHNGVGCTGNEKGDENE